MFHVEHHEHSSYCVSLKNCFTWNILTSRPFTVLVFHVKQRSGICLTNCQYRGGGLGLTISGPC